MPSVELLYYMHNFQRRLCWVLSSLCQQEGEIPDITVNIASLKGNGNPSTEEVIKSFGDKLKIKHTVFNEDEKNVFAYPSLVKDRQIAASSCEWIFKPDGDHVFSPLFFNAMLKDLVLLRDCDRCMGSRMKITTEPIVTNAAVNAMQSLYIENAYQTAIGLPSNPIHKPSRIGNHVVFRRDVFNTKCNGKYAKRQRDNHLFNSGMGSHSDLWFRMRMGGTVLCHWPPYVHLDHTRDKELNYHTEEQR